MIFKSGKAAIVNYERVDSAEQRRIRDFVNGVCYVMNGEARRISELMVLLCTRRRECV